MATHQNPSTENRILQAAREVFTAKGRDGTRMQEIADRAGVNKTLLHYYFRSKEKLFYRVVESVIGELIRQVIRSSFSPAPFKVFLKRFITNHIDFLSQHQDMLGFLLWELKKDPQLIREVILKQFDRLGSTPFEMLSERIGQAVKKGEIRPVKPLDFIINLASLDIFVMALLPVLAPVTALDSKQLQTLIQNRKKEVFRLLWNDIAPREDI